MNIYYKIFCFFFIYDDDHKLSANKYVYNENENVYFDSITLKANIVNSVIKFSTQTELKCALHYKYYWTDL